MNLPAPVPPYETEAPKPWWRKISFATWFFTVIFTLILLLLLSIWASIPNAATRQSVQSYFDQQALEMIILDSRSQIIPAIHHATITDAKAYSWVFADRFNACVSPIVYNTTLNIYLNPGYLYLGEVPNPSSALGSTFRFQKPDGNAFETTLIMKLVLPASLPDDICTLTLAETWQPSFVEAFPTQ